MRLLLTRPQDDARETAATLRARGHEVMEAPLLRVVPIDEPIGAGPWAAVIVTSANACRVFAERLTRAQSAGDEKARLAALLERPVYAVGPRTARAAREAGFTCIEVAQGDAATLLRLILAQTPRSAGKGAEPFLHLAGADRAADIAGELTQAGIPARTVTLYKAEAAQAFPETVRRALAQGELDGVLHFSIRSAQTFLACARGIEAAALAPMHFCLSAPIAAVLTKAGAARVRHAARPAADALLDLIADDGQPFV